MTNSNDASNGKSDYKPAKTWEYLGEEIWFEENEEIPGQERIVDDETLYEELALDDDPQQDN